MASSETMKTTKTFHKFRQKSKRGGTFTREQLEIMKDYLKTKKFPNRSKLLQAKFPLDSVLKEPKPLFLAACRRLMLSGESLCHVKGNRVVIPMEEFVSKIKEAHEGDYKELLHLNYLETLMKLSDQYTIGRRKYGMSKDLVEAVVKSCNSGPCYRKKRSSKKIVFGEQVEKFEKKCMELTINETSSSDAVRDEGNTQEAFENDLSMSADVNVQIKNRKKHKAKKQLDSDVQKMPMLVQMLQKPVATNGVTMTTTSSGTTATISKPAIISKPATITIGPVSLQAQPGKETSQQYQLGILVPVINNKSGTDGQQSLTVAGKVPTTQTLCIPIKTINGVSCGTNATSTATLTSGSTQSSPDNSGIGTKTITLSQMHFSKLLQNMAKNSQLDKNSTSKVSVTFSATPSNATSQGQNQASISLGMNPVTQNVSSKTNISVEKPEMKSTSKNATTKTESVKKFLQDTLEIKKKKLEIVKKNMELSKLNLKLSEQKLKMNKMQIILNTEPPKKKSKSSTQKKETEKLPEETICIDSDSESFSEVNASDIDHNNNTTNIDHEKNSYDADVSWTEENQKALDNLKNCGLYKNCLKALCSLGEIDFEAVIDRLHTNMFSEGLDPLVIPFHHVAKGDPPYPNIWYFYHDIRKEKNTFHRLLMVIKDIKIDWMKLMMHELMARDRIKRKLNYMDVLIRRNQDYLELCDETNMNRQRLNVK